MFYRRRQEEWSTISLFSQFKRNLKLATSSIYHHPLILKGAQEYIDRYF
jgi:hypothetical protein